MSRSEIFRERLSQLWTAWKSPDENRFGEADALAVATGVFEADADIGYLKAFALVTWLFGAELQGSAVIISKEKVLIILAKEYYADLSSLSSAARDALPVIEIVSAAETAANEKALKDVLGECKNVGVLVKEIPHQQGDVADMVNKNAQAAAGTVNISSALAHTFSVKDDEEVGKIKKAAFLTANVVKLALIQKIEHTIDAEKKTSHRTLSETAEEAIVNPSKVRLRALKAEFCDPCYPPIIQSADAKTSRKFDLKPSAESTDETLKFGCIVFSVGARYNFYCSNASRTLLVQPSKQQEKVYGVVLKAQEKAIAALVPGAPLKSAYLAAKSVLEDAAKEHPSLPPLAPVLTKNVGFGMGIEFRDSALVLNTKNESKVRERMIFNVSVGVQNISDKENGNYSILIADTVMVRDEKLGPEVYTTQARKDFKHISYVLRQDDDDEIEEVTAAPEKSRRRTNGDHVNGDGDEERGRGRRRAAVDVMQQGVSAEETDKQKKHQEELAEKMLARALKKLEGREVGEEVEEEEKRKKLLDEFRAYSSAKSFPSVRPRQIVVDLEAEAIIAPINGVPVPFHISVIKSATKSDEGQYSYLRINFFVPQNIGSTARKGIQRVAANTPSFPEFGSLGAASAAYVKELSYRSSNPQNLGDVMRKIKELRKRMTAKETQAIEMQTLVIQRTLIPERRHRPIVLADVSCRPPLAKGKYNKGVLEAHQNGFRFRARSGNVDIIYANIRNAFFQPADKQVIVILHFHLKNEIMVGKKKSKDIQFYVQVVEAAVKLNDKRRRQFDQDELEEEQRERDMKNRISKSFQKFTREVTERYNVDFDVPYRELAFEGAPKSQAVTLVPTMSCIVDLVDVPPFILNLDDVEVAHFERVSFQLRMFDVVFVFKWFDETLGATGKKTIRTVKDMWLRISSIPMEELAALKQYLDRQNIKFYEGPANIQWNEVLKKIRLDLSDFYESGGWNFLSMDGGAAASSDDEPEEDSDEGDMEFQPDESEAENASDGSSDYSADSDASGAMGELGGDSDAGEEELSSGEEGEDWDELDRKAKKFDRERGDKFGEGDDDRPKKRLGKSGRGTPSKKARR